jgi:hypothetical protein
MRIKFAFSVCFAFFAACSSAEFQVQNGSRSKQGDPKGAEADGEADTSKIEELSADNPQEITGSYLTIVCGRADAEEAPRRKDQKKNDLDMSLVGCYSDDSKVSLKDRGIKAYLKAENGDSLELAQETVVSTIWELVFRIPKDISMSSLFVLSGEFNQGQEVFSEPLENLKQGHAVNDSDKKSRLGLTADIYLGRPDRLRELASELDLEEEDYFSSGLRKTGSINFERLKFVYDDHDFLDDFDHFSRFKELDEQFFGLIIKGQLFIPESGEWEFDLNSDDAAHLFVNDKTIIRNPESHTFNHDYIDYDNETDEGPGLARGKIYLERGFHKIQVLYTQTSGGRALILSWRQQGSQFVPIPAGAYRR